MAILSKGETFTATSQVTSGKLHDLVDDATFVSGSGGTTDNSTLEVHTDGRLRIKDGGVTSGKIATDAVSPDAIDQDGGEYLLDDLTAVTTKLTPYVDAAVTGTATLDLSNGNFQQWTLTGNVTTVSAPEGLEAGQQFTIIVDVGNAPYTMTGYDATWKWQGGSAPTLTDTADAIDIISGVSDGTNVYVTLIKNFA